MANALIPVKQATLLRSFRTRAAGAPITRPLTVLMWALAAKSALVMGLRIVAPFLTASTVTLH